MLRRSTSPADPALDGSTLSRVEYVLLVGGIAFLLAMVLPWFGARGYSENGLDFFVTGIVPLLLLGASIGLVFLRERTDADLPLIPVGWELVELALAGSALLLVLLRLLLGSTWSGVDSSGQPASIDLSVRFGLFLAVLGAGAVVGALVVRVRDEGGFEQLRGGSGRDPFPPNPT